MKLTFMERKPNYNFIATKKSNIQGLSLWYNDCPFESKKKGLERYDNNIQYCVYIYIYIYMEVLISTRMNIVKE